LEERGPLVMLLAMPSGRALVAWGVPVALACIHQWVAPRGATLWLGLPLEWWVRLAWIAAAWLYLLWFARVVWQVEPEPSERGSGDAAGPSLEERGR